jgi:hypothetical protein
LLKRFDCGVKQLGAVIGGLRDTMTVELSKRNESDHANFGGANAAGATAPSGQLREGRAVIGAHAGSRIRSNPSSRRRRCG